MLYAKNLKLWTTTQQSAERIRKHEATQASMPDIIIEKSYEVKISAHKSYRLFTKAIAGFASSAS